MDPARIRETRYPGHGSLVFRAMRMRSPILVVLLTLVLLIVAPAVGAVAVTSSADGDVLAVDDGPAVEAPEEVEEDEEQPWTARFLAPTVLLLGVVALGGSILYYGVRIRGKYTVTD